MAQYFLTKNQLKQVPCLGQQTQWGLPATPQNKSQTVSWRVE